mgnify:CR=1 FL=1
MLIQLHAIPIYTHGKYEVRYKLESIKHAVRQLKVENNIENVTKSGNGNPRKIFYIRHG